MSQIPLPMTGFVPPLISDGQGDGLPSSSMTFAPLVLNPLGPLVLNPLASSSPAPFSSSLFGHADDLPASSSPALKPLSTLASPDAAPDAAGEPAKKALTPLVIPLPQKPTDQATGAPRLLNPRTMADCPDEKQIDYHRISVADFGAAMLRGMGVTQLSFDPEDPRFIAHPNHGKLGLGAPPPIPSQSLQSIHPDQSIEPNPKRQCL